MQRAAVNLSDAVVEQFTTRWAELLGVMVRMAIHADHGMYDSFFVCRA